MKAVIYARYSSDNQREESIEGQLRECTAYCVKNDITILRTYIDRALSAKTDNRPDFQRMVKDSAKGLFDVVIVWKLDRFARNRYDSAHYKAQLRKYGVKVLSATENISEGPEGIILESMLEGMAEYYSAELSEKVIRGHTENALKCKYNGGTPTFGYVIDKDMQYQLDPRTAPVQVSSRPQHPQDSSVTLRDVRFSYDGKTEVIKGVSMDIKPGQTVALVGPSGGGKSTLASLICRFFDVQGGSIAIGGADVRSTPKEELMDTVAFVFQNSRLLKGSILDNVRLGKPDATEDEVLAALKTAQCMDIIEKFPDGIHTVIGSKGVYLSGGEQQRIAIARAVLKNAPVLILDEATAFADPDNEARVQAAFGLLAKGKTVIMIAHRLSTVVSADCIYVVEDGQIAESGTKDELCAKGGLFAKMWQEYQSSVQWKVAKEG